MGDDEPDMAEAFADPAACGLASALLLLLSVLVAVAGGRGADAAVVAVDLEFEFQQSPDRFTVAFAMNGQVLCRVENGTATSAGPLVSGPVDLFRDRAAGFRTPEGGKSAIGFTADPLRPAPDTPEAGRRKKWRVAVVVQFSGPPRAIELGCTYSGDFALKQVTVRGSVMGAAGEPPPPVVYAPSRSGFRAILDGGRVRVTD